MITSVWKWNESTYFFFLQFAVWKVNSTGLQHNLYSPYWFHISAFQAYHLQFSFSWVFPMIQGACITRIPASQLETRFKHSYQLTWVDSNMACSNIEAIVGATVSQITSISIVCLPVCWGADQWKHQSSSSLAFVRGIHQWLVDSLHVGSVTRKMFPSDDVIMYWLGSFEN